MATVAQDENLGSENEVRVTLNNDQSLDPEVIERKLEAARVHVDAEASGGPSTAALKEGVIALAAWKIASSDAMTKQKRADGVSKTWDSAEFREDLRADVERAMDAIRGFWAVSL